MGHEIELKLHIEDAAQMQTVRSFPELHRLAVGQEEQICMETTYYDAPDGGISSRYWTFRRRRENGVCITCLKTPAAGDDPAAPRGEWETTVPELPQAIGQLLADGAPKLLAELTANGVVATCGAAFVRRAQLLRFSDGSTAELACDAGELFGDERREAFFEIELELKSGEPTQMFSFGERLQAAYELHPEPKSKFARANALRSRPD